MNKEYYDKIADLMMFSVSLKKGDKLNIQLNHDCRDAVKSLVYKAYERGASWVGLRYIDDFVNAAAIKAGRKSVEYPSYIEPMLKEISEPDWKTISYLSFSDEGVYQDLPGDVSAEYFKQYQKVLSYRRHRTMSGAVWSGLLPSSATAESAVKVFPDLEPSEALEAYWKQVISIMRLDHDDPVAFWKGKFEKDEKRKKYMEELGADSLHFRGPGTDLIVGLNRNAPLVRGNEAREDR